MSREKDNKGNGKDAAASPKSSIPSINLPKSGGAIRGIGEKFAANPATGTGSMTVPIYTSPGRSGFGPQLSLSYDSGAGNGPFGFGWNLSLPSITRKTDKGLPQYFDGLDQVPDSDVFILSGSEDLVPVYRQDADGSWVAINPGYRRDPNGFWVRGQDDNLVIRDDEIDGYRVRRYRPRIEGLFARIERWTKVDDPCDVHWRSISKDNILTLYGIGDNSRIFDPTDPWRIFNWLISESRDDKGNAVIYTYKTEDADGVNLVQANERNRGDANDPRRKTNRYLKRICYGNRTTLLDDAGGRPRFLTDEYVRNAGWMFEVVFDYGEHDVNAPQPSDDPRGSNSTSWPPRNDPFSSYRAGFEVRTYRLCQRALMFHHIPDLPSGEMGYDGLVCSTDFKYKYSYEEDPRNLSNPVYSFLLSVTQAGYKRTDTGGYISKSLPPVEFQYTQPIVEETVETVDAESLENLPAGVDGSVWQWTDLHGEGIPGILTEQAGAWYYKRNLSPISDRPVEFAPLELVDVKPNLNLAAGAQFMDLAGDGQPDLVMLGGPMPGLYEHDDAEGWQPFRPFTSHLNRDMHDPNLKFVDLDGDGHADVLITEDDAFVWHASLAEEGFGPARRVFQTLDEEIGPRLVFADGTQSIYLADLSGDSLTDLVRIRNGEVCYWPNLGYGKFGAKVTMDNAPWFDNPEQFDQKRIRLADIDGSGTTDIIYLHRDGIRLYFNQSGNRWSAPQTLNVFPRIDDIVSIFLTDLFGNGTVCLGWSSSLPGDAARQMRYVDLMGGQKPHLLVKTINNLGAETLVQYASSTKFYLQDKQNGNPWVTRLPFPVHVVERVETFDNISRNRFVTRYAYHHGYFDGVEREFRGFGMVEQWDTEEIGVLEEGEFQDAVNIDATSYVPPVLTKTWFHTGAYLEGGKISRQFEHEYYREPNLTEAEYEAMLLPDTLLPSTDLTAQEEREACRVLKGSVLRQEIYAMDGTEKNDLPYSVSERNYTIECLQPLDGNRHVVFFAHPRETIDYHYERNLVPIEKNTPDRKAADPRVSHQITLKVDEYGNVVRSLAIAYPRRALSDRRPEQAKTHATLTVSRFANCPSAQEWYRIGLLVETQTYEVVNPPESTVTATSTGLLNFDDVLTLSEGLFPPDQLDPDAAALIPCERWNWWEDTGSISVPALRLIEHVRTLYRRNDLSGPLDPGKVESLALPHETYKLAFIPLLLDAIYGGRLADEAILSSEGGYVHSSGDNKWWIPSGQIFFSPGIEDEPETELAFAQQRFFTPHRFRDPFGNITSVRYDDYFLSVRETSDPVGNVLRAQNDYRVMQPWLITDPNDNRSAVSFDELGMVIATAVMGKENETEPERMGDTLDEPTTRFEYDLYNWINNGQPNYVRTLARERHREPSTRWQESYSYSDGVGREIQKKIQAEPGEVEGAYVARRWVGSGWTIFNNKGKPVKQYEPFFSTTHEYEFDKRYGVSSTLFYDPLERVVATLHPNHTYEKVVFDPWQQTTWDVNDTVLIADPKNDTDVGDFFGRLDEREYLPTWYATHTSGTEQEKDAALKAAKNAGTPSAIYLDTLGRTFLTIADNGPDEAGQEQRYETRLVLDIENNQRAVIDAKQRVVMSYDYDMLGNRIRQVSMDAGTRWMLNDVTEKPIRIWDSRGHEFSFKYDPLHRPTETKVVGGDGTEPLDNVYERIVYGEGQILNGRTDRELNLRGRPFLHYDTAGQVASEEYDFKGNLVRSSRRLTADHRRQPDWSTEPPDSVLENESFISETAYDALNRPVHQTAPHYVSMKASEVWLSYNEANFIETVEASVRGGAREFYVSNIDYNEKGQRTLLEYGNKVKAEYTYDDKTFRLIHLLTTRSSGDKLQDLHYTYDPTGNITYIRDDAQQTIYFNNGVIKPHCSYEYDPLYRLTKAVGREHIGQNTPVDEWDTYRTNLPHPGEGSAMRRYQQSYVYDEVGNILRMIHRGGNGSFEERWRREFSYNGHNNQLVSSAVGGITSPYGHDKHGNMNSMPHLSLMAWDFKDQLSVTQRQVVNNGTAAERTFYRYDASGQRIRKITEHDNGLLKNERIYLGGFEIYREYSGTGVTLERETLLVMDDQRRIAIVETKTIGRGELIEHSDKLIRYQFVNHLGSAVLEIGQDEKVISCEEYYPYGSTSYQAVRGDIEVSIKRFRYTGKERDEESGFYYHGARYYAAWVGRWTSCDPITQASHSTPYCFVDNRPIRFVDSAGLAPEPPIQVYRREGVAAAEGVEETMRRLWRDPGRTIRGLVAGELSLAGHQLGGSRLDIVTPARAFEHKLIRVSKYFSKKGELLDKKFDKFLRKQVLQLKKHKAAMQKYGLINVALQSARGKKQSMEETLLLGVKNATPKQIEAIRRHARTFLKGKGFKVGVYAVAQLKPAAQKVPYVGLVLGAYDVAKAKGPLDNLQARADFAAVAIPTVVRHPAVAVGGMAYGLTKLSEAAREYVSTRVMGVDLSFSGIEAAKYKALDQLVTGASADPRKPFHTQTLGYRLAGWLGL